MNDPKVNPFAAMQIAEALEERQTPDRRQSKGKIPEGKADRRKGNRRNKHAETSE